jgi:hypothetical protein
MDSSFADIDLGCAFYVSRFKENHISGSSMKTTGLPDHYRSKGVHASPSAAMHLTCSTITSHRS